MMGLGVGIDYALFIVTRYRQRLAEGREPATTPWWRHCPRRGGRCSFAGGTVVVSLLGLFLVGQPYIDRLSPSARSSPSCWPCWPPRSPCCRPCSASPAAPSTACTCPACSGPRRPGPGAGSGGGGAAPSSAAPWLGGAAAAARPHPPGDPAVLDAPGVHRLGQRPGHPDHPPGLRPGCPRGSAPGSTARWSWRCPWTAGRTRAAVERLDGAIAAHPGGRRDAPAPLRSDRHRGGDHRHPDDLPAGGGHRSIWSTACAPR